jgi:formate-dependent nitrite reductase membrane component NrfD
MGLPVFNVFLGLVAGYYYGNRIGSKNKTSENHSKIVKKVSLFTRLVMTFICIFPGYLALVDNETGNMIKNILELDFDVTRLMVIGIILIGGILLISATILLTRITMIKTINNKVN